MKEQVHVAVLDDNEDILLMVTTILELENYIVSSCNLLEDLEAVVFDSNKPDVILCDMLMSGLDGRDVCKSMKANPETADIPFVIFTAHPNARDSCMAAGADLFLEKPFDIDVLYETISRACARKKLPV